jgi:hypothetical protein
MMPDLAQWREWRKWRFIPKSPALLLRGDSQKVARVAHRVAHQIGDAPLTKFCGLFNLHRRVARVALLFKKKSYREKESAYISHIEKFCEKSRHLRHCVDKSLLYSDLRVAERKMRCATDAPLAPLT